MASIVSISSGSVDGATGADRTIDSQGPSACRYVGRDSKPVVVAALREARGRHGHDHRPSPHAAQLHEDDCGVRRVTTTRAAKCRVSVPTAHLSIRSGIA